MIVTGHNDHISWRKNWTSDKDGKIKALVAMDTLIASDFTIPEGEKGKTLINALSVE